MKSETNVIPVHEQIIIAIFKAKEPTPVKHYKERTKWTYITQDSKQHIQNACKHMFTEFEIIRAVVVCIWLLLGIGITYVLHSLLNRW